MVSDRAEQEPGVSQRVYESYLVNTSTGNVTDQVKFVDRDDAMQWAADCANTLGYSGVDPSQFKQIGEYVWKIDLNGPMNAVVSYSAVYSGVEHVAE